MGRVVADLSIYSDCRLGPNGVDHSLDDEKRGHVGGSWKRKVYTLSCYGPVKGSLGNRVILAPVGTPISPHRIPTYPPSRTLSALHE